MYRITRATRPWASWYGNGRAEIYMIEDTTMYKQLKGAKRSLLGLFLKQDNGTWHSIIGPRYEIDELLLEK